ncbi:AraC family transcriptional regulator [bacterium SCSIO 12741]|nr:AraC family transcriptional regulator [bacterium SCSIO 12741]
MNKHKTITDLLTSLNVADYQVFDSFHILKFKDHLDRLSLQTVSRQCDFFLLYFSNHYDADIHVDDTFFSAKDKTLISFLAPLQTLSVDVKKVDPISSGYMVAFEASFFQTGRSNFDIQQSFPFFNPHFSPVYFLEKGENVFSDLLQQIHSLFKEPTAENREIIRSYLNILLFEARKAFLEGSIKTTLSTRSQQIAFSFENLIKQHSRERQPLEFYAQKLNLSTVYLSECVKKATDKTAKQILKEYVLLDASTLLLQTTDTIDHISDTLGFSATSNFINFFKKESGFTPSRYRIEQGPKFS